MAGLEHLAGEYVGVICREIADRLANLPDKPSLKSVYFGGGTPGLIEPALIDRIIAELAARTDIEPNAEITIETTPQTIAEDKATSWRRAGINRISVGVASLFDHELKAIGRGHTAAQALDGVAAARAAGFINIGADLLYGLPGQTVESWAESLGATLALDLPHLSAYGLQLDAHSRLSNRLPAGSDCYPDDEQYAQMYETLLKLTAAAGLTQYEISNFSRPGFESKHNLTYWTNGDYLAFGVGAHRYIGGVRSSNWRSLKKYMRDWLGSETVEEIDPITAANEAMFLGLRTTRGIDLSSFRSRHGIDLAARYAVQIQRLSEGGFIELTEGRLSLSTRGVLVSNLVMAEFLL